jgi:DNA-binding transcriptional LysR family regulator
VGFLHLIGVASQSYIEEHGVPTWDNLGDHRFIDTDYYSSRTPTYAPWRNAVERGTVAHHCDNPFAYGLAVKAGMGIGLLGNFVLADTDFIPVGMGIHVKLPIYLHSETERLKSKPVRIMYQWLADVFSADRAVFGSELSLGASARDLVPRAIHHLTIAADLRHAHGP